MPYNIYIVQPGDTLSAVATNWYNDASLFKAILNGAGNPIANPNQIAVGQLLTLVQLDDYIEYDVQTGDTLNALAKAFFGKAALHNLILNNDGQPIPNPNAISVGQRLRIPSHARMSNSLTPNRLANLTYQATFGDTTLSGGLFSFANPDFGGDLSTTRLSQITYGDLSGDGVDDAAVILVSHTVNTTGHFSELFAVPRGAAEPTPFALNLVGAFLDDRLRVARFFVRERNIHVVGSGHGQLTLTPRRFAPIGDAMAVGVSEIT